MEIEQAQFVDKLQKKMESINLEAVAPLIGAKVKNDRIFINSLGKDFIFDRRGNMTSECHIISWVQAPMLSYITYKTHADITGRWISFREIKGGIEWQTLFLHQRRAVMHKEPQGAGPGVAGAMPALSRDKEVIPGFDGLPAAVNKGLTMALDHKD